MSGSPSILSRAAVAACVAAAGALVLTSSAFGSGGSQRSGASADRGEPVTTAAAAAPSAATLIVQGVVQSVSASAVAVRLLDGTATNIPYDRKTQVFVNGKSDRIADVRPGFVVSASWKAGRPATVLRFVRPS